MKKEQKSLTGKEKDGVQETTWEKKHRHQHLSKISPYHHLPCTTRRRFIQMPKPRSDWGFKITSSTIHTTQEKKNTKIPIEIGQKTWIDISLSQVYRGQQAPEKKWPPSFIGRDMQIKTKLRYQVTPPEWPSLIGLQIKKPGEDVAMKLPSYGVGGYVNWQDRVNLRNQYRRTIWPRNLTLEHIPRKYSL